MGGFHTPDPDAVTRSGTPAPIGGSTDAAEARRPGSERYVAIERLGAGGMGEVVRAYDPRLQREVALKRVRPELFGADAQGRLVREARAMAQLSHANVVGVYDVEVDADAVTLVMEYVAGGTLHAWLATPRDWREVVDVFTQAGRGLQAAHQAGLVHRDFKPANVLLDERRQAKVTDFGLAKPVRSQSSSVADETGLDSELTVTGSVLGTPRYMAPEQFSGGAIEAAADQYAFCVALWDALCGAPPFAGKNLARRKAEGPPPWPKPANVPRKISDVVLRGLSPQPSARYASMDALLQHLSRATRSGGTRRRAATAMAGVGMLVAAGAVGLRGHDETQRCTGAGAQLAEIWGPPQRAALAEAFVATDLRYAAVSSDQVAERLDAYGRAWVSQHTEACEATSLRGEQSAAVLDRRMACLTEAHHTLGATVALLTEADATVVERGVKMVDALPRLTRCEDVEALLARSAPPDDPALAREVSRIERVLTDVVALSAAARHPAAHELATQAAIDADAAGHEPLIARAQLAVGGTNEDLSRYDKAEEHLGRALRAALRTGETTTAARASTRLALVVGSRLGRADEGRWLVSIAGGLANRVDDPTARIGVAQTRGSIERGAGNYEAALRDFRESIEIAAEDAVVAERTRDTCHTNVGLVLRDLGRFEESEAELRTALELRLERLGPAHPDVGKAHNLLGLPLLDSGRMEAARDEFRAALEILVPALGQNHALVANAHGNLGNALRRLGEYDEAQRQLRITLEIFERLHGGTHAKTAYTRANLAALLSDTGSFEEAAAEYERAAEILEAILGPTHQDVGSMKRDLANQLLVLEQFERAEAVLAESRAVFAAIDRADHPAAAEVESALATLYSNTGRVEESIPVFRRAAEMFDRAGVGGSVAVAMYCNYAEAFMRLDRLEDALAVTQRGIEVAERGGISPAEAGDMLAVRARVLGEAGELGPAKATAREALARFATATPIRDDEAAELRAWLEALP